MKPLAPCLLLLSLATVAGARTWHVPADAPTIQAGIDSALVGDVVELAAGTYHETGLVLKTGLTLRGAGSGPADAVLDALGDGRLLTFETDGADAPTLISDLTFTGADSSAVYCAGVSDVTIERCAFRDNHAASMHVGGLHLYGVGPVVVRDCVFDGNRGDNAPGAVGASQFGEVRLERCLFVRNHSTQWGAVAGASYTGEPGLVLDQCTITGNTGAGYWTAVFIVGYGQITVHRTLVAHNEVQFATTGSGHLGFVQWTCSDLFDNAGDDYSYDFWGFDNGNGNFSADPCFCDPGTDDYTLAADSWCLPGHHPWDGCEDLVGAFGEGCAAVECAGPVTVEARTWSAVKGMFR